jgi:hypothetical protein
MEPLPHSTMSLLHTHNTTLCNGHPSVTHCWTLALVFHLQVRGGLIPSCSVGHAYLKRWTWLCHWGPGEGP